MIIKLSYNVAIARLEKIMIINLISESGELKFPYLWLDETIDYEIGIRSIGAATKQTLTQPELINVCYDGIRFLEGGNPYTMFMQIIIRNGFNATIEKPMFFPLRTNQLHYTSIKLKTEGSFIKFDKAYAQLEIRKVGTKGSETL